MNTPNVNEKTQSSSPSQSTQKPQDQSKSEAPKLTSTQQETPKSSASKPSSLNVTPQSSSTTPKPSSSSPSSSTQSSFSQSKRPKRLLTRVIVVSLVIGVPVTTWFYSNQIKRAYYTTKSYFDSFFGYGNNSRRKEIDLMTPKKMLTKETKHTLQKEKERDIVFELEQKPTTEASPTSPSSPSSPSSPPPPLSLSAPPPPPPSSSSDPHPLSSSPTTLSSSEFKPDVVVSEESKTPQIETIQHRTSLHIFFSMQLCNYF
jgi:hypothetical protein